MTSEPAGTVIVDTPHNFLYPVRGYGKALRCGIGVGRESFTWSGSERISPYEQMAARHPPKDPPRFMAGGERNPLGARALYLGNTIYRVHGTNQPHHRFFRVFGLRPPTNPDIEGPYGRVNIGTRVVVSPGPAPVSTPVQGPVAR